MLDALVLNIGRRIPYHPGWLAKKGRRGSYPLLPRPRLPASQRLSPTVKAPLLPPLSQIPSQKNSSLCFSEAGFVMDIRLCRLRIKEARREFPISGGNRFPSRVPANFFQRLLDIWRSLACGIEEAVCIFVLMKLTCSKARTNKKSYIDHFSAIVAGVRHQTLFETPINSRIPDGFFSSPPH